MTAFILLMNIPASCQTWAQLMRQGADGEPAILANLENEICLPHLEADFFALLATTNPASPPEALRGSLSVVRGQWEKFTCQGNLADPNRFGTLLRLSKTSSFRYFLPDPHRFDFLDAKGLDDSYLENATRSDRELLLAEYAAPVNVGGRLHLTWVADYAEATAPALPDKERLVDRLGLPHCRGANLLMFTYDRANLPGDLRVPRAFDGVDNPQFQLEPDCAALAGRTRPLTVGLPGFAEAIHRGIELPAGQYTLRFLP